MHSASNGRLHPEISGAGGQQQYVRASVIIVNFNGGDLVVRCLLSVHRHIGPHDEVILVDNGSTDLSVDAIRQMFPDLPIICNRENLGFGEGNNIGACAATGEYLVFLNPDTIVDSDFITPLLEPLERNPRTGMTTSRIVLLNDPATINTCGNEVHVSGITMCRGMGLPRGRYPAPERIGAVSGAAFAMRRMLFLELGGFDGAFFLYMEDTDLSLRARLAGYQVEYVPDSIVQHRYSLKFSNRKVYYQERNRYRMLLKVMGWRTLIALTPVYAAAEIVTWAFVLLRTPTQAVDKVRAYRHTIGSMPEILNQRRSVQATRRVTDRELLSACTRSVNFTQVEASRIARLAESLVNPVVLMMSRLSCAFVR